MQTLNGYLLLTTVDLDFTQNATHIILTRPGSGQGEKQWNLEITNTITINGANYWQVVIKNISSGLFAIPSDGLVIAYPNIYEWSIREHGPRLDYNTEYEIYTTDLKEVMENNPTNDDVVVKSTPLPKKWVIKPI